MVSTTHVIMTVHPVLVLLPILGFLVLPCAPRQSKNGLRRVTNMTVENCSLKYCPQNDSCSKAILTEKNECFLISCPNNTQKSSCENITNFNDLLAELSGKTNGPQNDFCLKAILNEKNECFLISCPNNTQKSSCENITNFKDLLAELSGKTNDSIHVDKNQTDNSALPNESSGTNSLFKVTQPLPTEPNVSTTRTSTTTKPATVPNNSMTIATINLQTTPAEKATTTAAVPKPTITTTTLTTPDGTSTTTTTPKPTTTSPKPSPTTTSTTTTSTRVAQTTIPKQPSSPSPSGTNTSASISPSVPTTPSSTPSAKPIQTSQASSLSTTPKTSLSPSVVASTLPKDIPKRDQAMIEVAGDPLTSHLLNTSSLLAVFLFGLLFFAVTVALFLKQAYESYRRKDYTQVDYLINGMYSDSGV